MSYYEEFRRLKSNLEQSPTQEKRRNARLSNVESAALDAIYAHISKWVGYEVKQGDPVPRNGARRTTTQYLRGFDSPDPMQHVVTARIAASRKDIADGIERLGILGKYLIDVQNYLIDLKPLEWAGAFYFARKCPAMTQNQALVQTIGIEPSLSATSALLLRGIDDAIYELERRLADSDDSNLGRPRNAGAYAVADRLAHEYYDITGILPTYGEGPDGISGEFTKALRDVFDAFGWEKRSLRGPAEEAIAHVRVAVQSMQ